MIFVQFLSRRGKNLFEASCGDSNENEVLQELDPVGSTVRYEMMKLCTGSVQDTTRRQQLVIGDTGSVEGIYVFIYCTKWRSGRVSRMPHCLTHRLKDSATQLLTNYKSGALVTQFYCLKHPFHIYIYICIYLQGMYTGGFFGPHENTQKNKGWIDH